MSKEISQGLKVVVMRNGVEITLEGKKLKAFEGMLEKNTGSQFIRLEGRTINTADLMGVYLPEDLEVLYMKKRGMWQCSKKVWHERNEDCFCNRPPGR